LVRFTPLRILTFSGLGVDKRGTSRGLLLLPLAMPSESGDGGAGQTKARKEELVKRVAKLLSPSETCLLEMEVRDE